MADSDSNGQQKRLIVGLSGASGVIFGARLLELLKPLNVQVHLVITKAAEMTLSYETDLSVKDLRALADASYSIQNVGAAIASGSFRADGMIIAPCSIKTLSEIATGLSSNLLTRAADVMLKERRRLVLMVRETPLHLGHLRSMIQATENGAIVAPAVPAMYAGPQTLDDVITQTAARLLDLVDINHPATHRWGEKQGT